MWNTDVPGGYKVKILQKSLSPILWPALSTPRGMGCPQTFQAGGIKRVHFCITGYIFIQQLIKFLTKLQTSGMPTPQMTQFPISVFGEYMKNSF